MDGSRAAHVSSLKLGAVLRETLFYVTKEVPRLRAGCREGSIWCFLAVLCCAVLCFVRVTRTAAFAGFKKCNYCLPTKDTCGTCNLHAGYVCALHTSLVLGSYPGNSRQRRKRSVALQGRGSPVVHDQRLAYCSYCHRITVACMSYAGHIGVTNICIIWGYIILFEFLLVWISWLWFPISKARPRRPSK